MEVFKNKLMKRNFINMREMKNIEYFVADKDLYNYSEYLSALKQEFLVRFSVLFSLQIKTWMIDPFGCDIECVEEKIQEELIDLQCNEELKYKYKKTGNLDCR
ncbi:General transcription factor II-I repeat domain-containing protein 2 [Dictyocoela muelleri]|nr:General transcription factor II-I repeat domain-containing protein 2 [Dictyocoela muelleri]